MTGFRTLLRNMGKKRGASRIRNLKARLGEEGHREWTVMMSKAAKAARCPQCRHYSTKHTITDVVTCSRCNSTCDVPEDHPLRAMVAKRIRAAKEDKVFAKRVVDRCFDVYDPMERVFSPRKEHKPISDLEACPDCGCSMLDGHVKWKGSGFASCRFHFRLCSWQFPT